MPANPPGPGSRVDQLPILLNSREVSLRLGQQFMQVARGFGLNPPAGTARFWLFVDATGALSQIELEASSGTDALDAAGRRVVEEMKYRPAIVGDCAVSAWARVPVEFRMIRRSTHS